ncbi:Kinesin-like protein KIF9 [Bagarius yarrelli]|uniref:Kinesin-like protein n=1 Tax=Bagarius yarrelli TaxID=175774 RepID=A0A556TVD2_BAGYA|nr:Kinesin-like protein KIF9 [Bagarius yarrelli]
MSAHNGVTVYVRIRPTAQFVQELIELLPDQQTVVVRQKKKSRKEIMLNNQVSSWSFRFNGVLNNVTQEEVYQQVTHSVVIGALEGYNGTVMCYGQTGAGKTYTMTGATECYKKRGLIPRAIQEVFHEIDSRVDHTFSVHLSYLEIYNESLVDLLALVKGGQRRHCTTLAVVEESDGKVSIKGLSLHPVHTEEAALNLLFESRSRILSNATYVTSKLNLVDLAGSERLSKTGSEGQVQKEALYINRSLSFLEQAILALADQRREHVPFRQSKLTHALKDTLGGNCNTVLVANVYGEAEQIDETLSTLRFATRMKCVRTEPTVNKHIDPALQIQRLQKEIEILKHELSFHNTLADKAAVTYEEMSEAQLAVVKGEVQKYLAGTLDEISMVSVRQIQAVFAQFKKAFQEQEQRLKKQVESNQSALPTLDAKELVEEAGAENQLVAPASLQRLSVSPCRSKGKKIKESNRKSEQSSTDLSEPPTMTQSGTEIDIPASAAESEESTKDDAKIRCDTPPSKMEAFEIYKSEKGSEINRILKENKSVLKERLAELHKLTGIINSIKRDIDHTSFQLQLCREQRQSQGQLVSADGEPVLDEAEVTLLMKLRETKDKYRQNYEELLSTKAEVQYCRHLVDQCRVRIFTEFESWYNESFLLPEEEGDEQEHYESSRFLERQEYLMVLFPGRTAGDLKPTNSNYLQLSIKQGADLTTSHLAPRNIAS